MTVGPSRTLRTAEANLRRLIKIGAIVADGRVEVLWRAGSHEECWCEIGRPEPEGVEAIA